MTTMCIISVIASPPLPLDVLITCSTSWWPHLGAVHTNPFSRKTELLCSGHGYRPHYNAGNDHRKRSHSKTLSRVERFENDAFWKRRFLVWTEKTMLFANGDTTGRQTARPWVIQNGGQTLTKNQEWRQFRVPKYIEMRMRRVHLSMRTECIKAFSKRVRHCSVDGRKRYENDKCGRKSFWKRGKTAPFLFENGLVWTGP